MFKQAGNGQVGAVHRTQNIYSNPLFLRDFGFSDKKW